VRNELPIVKTIVIIALIMALAGSPAGAASYLQQSRWIARCYAWGAEDKVQDADTHLVGCMNKAGYVFCPECKTFGGIGGVRCKNDKENAHDRPACWQDRDPFHPRVDPSFDDIFAPCSSWSNVNCWEQSE
jgi:hypothetical protein